MEQDQRATLHVEVTETPNRNQNETVLTDHVCFLFDMQHCSLGKIVKSHFSHAVWVTCVFELNLEIQSFLCCMTCSLRLIFSSHKFALLVFLSLHKSFCSWLISVLSTRKSLQP